MLAGVETEWYRRCAVPAFPPPTRRAVDANSTPQDVAHRTSDLTIITAEVMDNPRGAPGCVIEDNPSGHPVARTMYWRLTGASYGDPESTVSVRAIDLCSMKGRKITVRADFAHAGPTPMGGVAWAYQADVNPR